MKRVKPPDICWASGSGEARGWAPLDKDSPLKGTIDDNILLCQLHYIFIFIVIYYECPITLWYGELMCRFDWEVFCQETVEGPYKRLVRRSEGNVNET